MRIFLIISILLLSSTLLLINCDTAGSSGGNGVASEPLSFFEEELVSKWARYHAYDGSTDYFIFNSDRTGCKFTIESNYSRTSTSTYVYWGLDEDNPVGNNVFLIQYKTAGGTVYTSGHEYHYNEDVVWYGGYSNLDMYHSTSSYDCE